MSLYNFQKEKNLIMKKIKRNIAMPMHSAYLHLT